MQWNTTSNGGDFREKSSAVIEDEVMDVLAKEKEMGHEMKVCIGTDSQVERKIHRVRYRNCIRSQRKRRVHVYPQRNCSTANEHQTTDARGSG